MEVLIIVNEEKIKLEKLKEQYLKYKKQILYIFILICSLSVGYNIFFADSGKVHLEENIGDVDVNAKKVKDTKSRVLYAISPNDIELKNPFNFEHETPTAKLKIKENENTMLEDVAIKAEQIKEHNLPENQEAIKTKVKAFKKKSEKNCELTAVMDMGNSKIAIVKIDDKSHRVSVGDSIDDVEVISIGKSDIILKFADEDTVKYKLKGF